ncbi:hypothetical protein [Acinetobacter sp.]|jgi:hypothetical protein|uniref:hypothetical protein n=1 Tax=Acinetobacter sp. TaxID=472 RepID=UPI0028337819|nr:hypothetical protein [Acinetobacter sp.]MDR0235867.1 hypothetical protein [Acinetobacter sp.]
MIRDSAYILDILENFFKDKEIKKKFQIIQSSNITGWEIWLQIEFAYFLNGLESSPEWYRESSYEYDRRKEKIKLKLKPDFLIRKKGWRLDEYMALEFKQDMKPVSCLKKMLVDLDKFSKVKKSNDNIRSVWTLGIFYTEDLGDVKAKFSKVLDEHGGYKLENLTIAQINKTNYWFVLL